MAGAGAAQSWALVHTAAWALPLGAVALLAMSLALAPPQRAFWRAWSFGVGAGTASVWWLFISMHTYGGLPAPLAALAVLALTSVLALYLGAAGWALARWRTHLWAVEAVRFAALWGVMEWARGRWFTGFPWGALGYTQIDGPLATLAPWVGVNGMGVAAAACAGALGLALATRWRQGAWRRGVGALAGVAALLLALHAAGPGEHTHGSGPLQVRLLQTQVPQEQKFTAVHVPPLLAWVARALAESPAELSITPETAVPMLPGQLEQLMPGYWPAVERGMTASGRHALVGVPLGSFEQGYTNSVVGLGPSSGAPYRYDKFHLVPFGEFVPWGFRWFTELMNIPLGDFQRGVTHPPAFAVRDQRVAPTICYEDLFGEELARRFGSGATAPTVLANISNIAWFGDTPAVPQHLNISRMRALEFQRPMVRATNTGATAAISHTGQVLQQMPPFTRGVLDTEVHGRQGLTPYARWAARWGLWPLVLACGLALVLLSLLVPRPSRVSAQGQP